MTAHRNEAVINAELAAALRERHPQWNQTTVVVESTRTLREAGRRPDLIVRTPGRQPVGIETEFDPARTVQQDAQSRLGARLAVTGEPIESVLAVILPKELQTGPHAQARAARYRYAALQVGADGKPSRFPHKDWLEGGVNDLADAIEHLSLSEAKIAASTRILEQVVSETAALLEAGIPEAIQKELAACLHQQPGEQTHRMAAAIFVSAFVFHSAIDGQAGIPRFQPLLPPARLTQSLVLNTWDDILTVNYWPIFSIARDLAKLLPVRDAPAVFGRVAQSVEELAQTGATTYHDLCGRMFQTLISDRKFLATFYTLPSSATYLAELAVERLTVDWSDAKAISRLRIGDFACGTGALLSAVQRAIYRRHRRAGGDDQCLHKAMMEQVLTGLDIMPAAAHLTCSMLSSAHPTIGYGLSGIHTFPYGVTESGVHIGALDLLASNQGESLFGTDQTGMAGHAGSVSLKAAAVPDEGFDLVIMNPPFTRPTNHESTHAGVPVPSFAGFDNSADEQRHMANALRKHKGVAGHGNAGLASNFIDLAHVKLRDDGVLALVLPYSFISGDSWRKSREFLQTNYRSAVTVAIGAAGQHARAFSADTGMAECLVLASKGRKPSDGSAIRSHTLPARPDNLLQAAVNASSFDIARTMPHIAAAGARHESLVRVAAGLAAGKLVLPRKSATPLPVVLLTDLTKRRPVYHLDINGGRGRGPFEVRETRAGYVAEYPALWAHDAVRERKLIVQTDRVAEPRPGAEHRAMALWNEAASRLHATLDFQLNSQSLAMCLTPEICIGGTAWPNVIAHDLTHEIPLCLWANTTLGLICHWWTGTRQQQGRARLTISRLPDLPVLDARTLTGAQLAECNNIFADLKDKGFLPANEAYRDDVRKELDQRMLVDVLGFSPSILASLDTLRLQWCSEPSVHGGKSTQPPASAQ